MRTTFGSKLQADFVPDEDEPVVERLKKAGAILLGKTNTSEFGWKSPTDNRVFGPTRNPWSLDRTPAGSSGGSAAAVAVGMGPLALGTDGGGSVRQPASFCGIFGLRPSFGLVPNYRTAFNRAFSFVGFPSLSVPVGETADGMPVGIQLVGPPFAEARLLAVGQALERAVGNLPARWGIDPRRQ